MKEVEKEEKEEDKNAKYNGKERKEDEGEEEEEGSFVDILGALCDYLNSLKKKIQKITCNSFDSLVENMTPIQAAQLNATLAFFLTSLYFMRLKVQGKDAAGHPIKKDIQRVRSHMNKIAELLKEEELRKERRMRIDVEAAKRFVAFHFKQKKSVQNNPSNFSKYVDKRFAVEEKEENKEEIEEEEGSDDDEEDQESEHTGRWEATQDETEQEEEEEVAEEEEEAEEEEAEEEEVEEEEEEEDEEEEEKEEETRAIEEKKKEKKRRLREETHAMDVKRRKQT